MIDPILQPVAFIQEVTAKQFGIPVAWLAGRERSELVASARQAAYYVSLIYTNRSVSFIAGKFDRDPKTVRYGIQRAHWRILNDRGFAANVARISMRCSGGGVRRPRNRRHKAPLALFDKIGGTPLELRKKQAQKKWATQGAKPVSPTLADGASQ